jgi:hypothetical protein
MKHLIAEYATRSFQKTYFWTDILHLEKQFKNSNGLEDRGSIPGRVGCSNTTNSLG